MGGTIMNDPLRYIEQIAVQARKEKTPTVSVADQVLLRIREARPVGYGPLAWIAAGSAAIAAGVAAFVVPLIQAINSPLTAFFHMSLSYIP